jgi:hypothetical protein
MIWSLPREVKDEEELRECSSPRSIPIISLDFLSRKPVDWTALSMILSPDTEKELLPRFCLYCKEHTEKEQRTHILRKLYKAKNFHTFILRNKDYRGGI